MKKFSTLLTICGLFLVTGCQEEESVESSVGSSTPVVRIEDNPSDCCAQPDEKPRDPEEEPPSRKNPLCSWRKGRPRPATRSDLA